MLPPLVRAMERLFWFFTPRATPLPFLLLLPIFASLGALTPLPVQRAMARRTIVERLRGGGGVIADAVAATGALAPLPVQRAMARRTIVERLREAEA